MSATKDRELAGEPADAPGTGLNITAQQQSAIAAGEEATKKFLRESEQVEVYVESRVTGGGPLKFTYNGVLGEVPVGRSVRLPKPIADLVRVRCDKFIHDEEAAVARSRGR